MLEAGTVLGGKYRLDAEIGRGGMGSVWRATRLDLGTELAVKVMCGEALNKPGGLDRFSREAKAAASLTSPHVVRIIDFGADTAGSIAFMAMELLVGESLSDRISSVRALAPQQVASFITQVARALAQAHAAGIVHRDLKPANIFLVQNADDEMAKLLDFGIAKAGDGLSTVTGSVLGTPYYMSPEQVSSCKDIDHRTDLWSLGVIACECMTGQLPFAAETLSELAMKIALGRAKLPSSLGPVPEGFDEWFARATNVDRTGRFQSARELANALARVVGPTSGFSVSAPDPELSLAATLGSAQAPRFASGQPPRSPKAATVSSIDSKLSTTSAGSTTVDSPPPSPKRSRRLWRFGVPVAGGAAIIGAVYLGGFYERGGIAEPVPLAGARATEPAIQVGVAGSAAAPSAPNAPSVAPLTAASSEPRVAPLTAAPSEPVVPRTATGQAKASTGSPEVDAEEDLGKLPVASARRAAQPAAAGGASKSTPDKAGSRAPAARQDTRVRAGQSATLTDPPADKLDAYDLQ